MFHTHVASIFSGCCICFTHMLQVFYLDVAYVFHTHVASVLSKYCIYFTDMLQQYDSNVSSVSDVCCIQMFHVASVSREHVE